MPDGAMIPLSMLQSLMSPLLIVTENISDAREAAETIRPAMGSAARERETVR